MSRTVSHFFFGPEGTSSIQLDFNLEMLINDWNRLRLKMVRSNPVGFSRAELAYLIHFIDSDHLKSIFSNTFGCVTNSDNDVTKIYSPKKNVALWLPNNVSLLGPLTLIMLSLLGSSIRIKAGSRSRDLTTIFIKWILEAGNLGPLSQWLETSVEIDNFDRNHTKNIEMANWANVRILYGSDNSAESIEVLPHPVNSIGYYFTNRVSEVWVEAGMINDDFAREFIKVLLVYGQAGCTSPKRVVIIDGVENDAIQLKELLSKNWENHDVESEISQIASENFMLKQLALANGLKAHMVGFNSAVIIIAPASRLSIGGQMTVHIQWGTLDEAVISQSDDIQSIGYLFKNSRDKRWRTAFSKSQAVRLIPLINMHQFGPVWDGLEWWKGLFNVKELVLS